MGASLLWSRLHDINPDLFHVSVRTEGAVQEALCMDTRYGQSLAFSALHKFSTGVEMSVASRQRCEYKSCIHSYSTGMTAPGAD